MTNPQLDGYTQIANGIVEALAQTHLSGYEVRVLWCIFRKTYGWNKKMDRISFSQFEEATMLSRRHIAPTIKRLIKRNMIICRGDKYKLEYGIQDKYENWYSLPKSVMNTITENGNDSLPKSVMNTITENGNDSLPKSVMISGDQSLPISDQSLPISDRPLPKSVTKSLPKSVNTKTIIHITKALDKNKGVVKGVFGVDEKIGEIFSIFENEISQLTPMISESLKELTEKYPVDWITDAIKESARRNKRNLAYIGGILRNREEGNHGAHSRSIKSIPGQEPGGAFDFLKKQQAD